MFCYLKGERGQYLRINALNLSSINISGVRNLSFSYDHVSLTRECMDSVKATSRSRQRTAEQLMKTLKWIPMLHRSVRIAVLPASFCCRTLKRSRALGD